MDVSLNKETGKIVEGPNFDPHIGRQILKRLKENENKIHQIEITSGSEESCGSFRLRTIRTAQHLKTKELKIGDVVLLCGVNHNDLSVPFVASQYIGLIPIGLVVGMTQVEIEHFVRVSKPKIVFSDPSMVDIIHGVLNNFNMDVDIVVFGEADERTLPFSDFIEPTGSEEDFTCERFDPSTAISCGTCSSGSTGLPKIMTMSHKAMYLMVIVPFINMLTFTAQGSFLQFSPIYWSTGSSNIIGSCLLGYTRLQCAKPYTFEILKDAIEKYKPPKLLISPFAILSVLKNPPRESFDFSSIKLVIVGGSSLSCDVFQKFQKIVPNAKIFYIYGSSEIPCVSFGTNNTKSTSVGKVSTWIQWKIVDIETEKTLGLNETGELRLKSVIMFSEYMNNPEATKSSFDEEGYLKTGDLAYFDKDGEIYIVDRIKEMIKCRDCQISPVELENLIRTLPEVIQVAVVGIRDNDNIENPVAIVKLVPGAKTTAQQIKDLVTGTLSSFKALRGGVIFIDNFSTTHSDKVDRKALKLLASTSKSE